MTAIMINGDIHTLIVEKQREIRKRYKMYIRISDVVTVIIHNGIGNIEEFLGLGKEGEYIKKDKPDIINMANKIGIDVVCVKENIDNLADIPCIYGVYVIITESGKIYIGASVDIHSRMAYHRFGAEGSSSVDMYTTKNKSDAYLLEQYLIRELNPGLNRQKSKIFSRKTAKTVPIEDDVYFLIMGKQRDILEKYGVNITVSQIIDTLLKNYICKIEEFFHIKV